VTVAVSAATAPSAPAVSVSRNSATSLHFAWGSGTAGSCPITAYDYQIDGGSWNPSAASSAVDVGNGYQQTHTVAIRVTDSCGHTGSASGNGTTDTATPPTAPGVAVSHNSATSLHFSWGSGSATAAGCSITGYQYQVNGGGFTATGANSGVDLGNGYSQSYTVTLQVSDSCGHSATSSGSGQTDPPPPTVSVSWGARASSSICGGDTSCTFVTISWSNFSGGNHTASAKFDGAAWGVADKTVSGGSGSISGYWAAGYCAQSHTVTATVDGVGSGNAINTNQHGC